MEVKVPQLPESVTDATLVSWHRKVGETVRRDENLVDLETDKVVLEVPSPINGVLVEIKAKDGSIVTSGELLAVIEPADAPTVESQALPAVAAAASAPAAVAAERGVQDDAQAASGGSSRMGPAVRNLLDGHDIDPTAIKGTGRDGIITKGDVLDYLARHQDSTSDVDDGESPSHEVAPAAGGARVEQRVAMTRLRARVAERLVTAQATAAMLTTFNEIDMSEVMALRSRYKEAFLKRYEVKLGFMSFFVQAAVEALREFPLLNASVDGADIVYHEYFDVGIAVSTDRGLVVPVLRDVQTMSFADVEKGIVEFGERARTGGLGLDDLTGGTFTITNGGTFGSLLSTPILNPPQSAILGMHKIQQRPMVIDGAIVARPMMYVALTYDHRIVDGREAVQFLVHIKDLLEDPARLTLQV
jgi:2-oxoglutarate dehydrogenase E2 component (dihydrolipoamide succinyltransferase)